MCLLRCATLCYVTQHEQRGHLPTLSHAVLVDRVLGPGGSWRLHVSSSVRSHTNRVLAVRSSCPSIHQHHTLSTCGVVSFLSRVRVLLCGLEAAVVMMFNAIMFMFMHDSDSRAIAADRA